MRTPFYTGSGDGGSVHVGARALAKSDPLFETLGQLDALNSQLGWVRVAAAGFTAEALLALQEMLFVAQAEVASLGFGGSPAHRVRKGFTAHLEQIIGYADGRVPPLTTFIVPGGCELAARLDVARTAARSLERQAVAAAGSGGVHLTPELLAFLNRLSSSLFALARLANHEAGVAETPPSYLVGR